MTRFSRWMPPPARHSTTLGTVVLIGLLALCVVTVVRFEASRLPLAIVFLAFVVLWFRDDRRLRRLSRERSGEDIGSFARAFDHRRPEFDSWVIRAVWDALQPYRTHRGVVAPLRPSDRLKEFVDPDDLDWEVAVEAATRAGRTLEDAERNPKYGGVETVEDLVIFLWHQPRCRPDQRMEPARNASGPRAARS